VLDGELETHDPDGVAVLVFVQLEQL
jgi:hypothetical protein